MIKIKYILFILTLSLINIYGASSIQDLKVIATIPEASGICFSKNTNTLFVANDEGIVYEISKEGNIIRKKIFSNYDLEGVACTKNKLYLAVEGNDNILVLKKDTLEIIKEIDISRTHGGINILKKDKSHGLEGIAIFNSKIYLSNQSYDMYPTEDSSVILTVDLYSNKKRNIIDILNHTYTDIAGLTFRNNELYMLSDSEDLLINLYTLKEYKLPNFAQEGIAFDNQNNIYFADDDGRVLKGKFNE